MPESLARLVGLARSAVRFAETLLAGCAERQLTGQRTAVRRLGELDHLLRLVEQLAQDDVPGPD